MSVNFKCLNCNGVVYHGICNNCGLNREQQSVAAGERELREAERGPSGVPYEAGFVSRDEENKVGPDEACPFCKESDTDNLIWQKDEESVLCVTCDHIYVPGDPATKEVAMSNTTTTGTAVEQAVRTLVDALLDEIHDSVPASALGEVLVEAIESLTEATDNNTKCIGELRQQLDEADTDDIMRRLDDLDDKIDNTPEEDRVSEMISDAASDMESEIDQKIESEIDSALSNIVHTVEVDEDRLTYMLIDWVRSPCAEGARAMAEGIIEAMTYMDQATLDEMKNLMNGPTRRERFASWVRVRKFRVSQWFKALAARMHFSMRRAG